MEFLTIVHKQLNTALYQLIVVFFSILNYHYFEGHCIGSVGLNREVGCVDSLVEVCMGVEEAGYMGAGIIGVGVVK